ncbi:MAG: zinc protease protein-like protein [Ramlibacter sp.]|nr:zinc protease protein-like protein [Ramlibacter sp.]
MRANQLPAAAVARGALAALSLVLFHGFALAAIPIQQWTQPSGAKVYFVESPSIPMVDVRIEFDAGGRREPADKSGLASVAAGMTDKGLTAAKEGAAGNGPYGAALDENQLSDAWADLGAGFGGSASSDRMSFSLRSLTYPDLLAKSVQLASRQLGDPAFPPEIWQRERQRLSASIRESNTRPGTIAGRAYSAAVYGTHPYSHEMTEESLQHISVEDMRQQYRLLEPCRAKVSIVGAVTRAQADAMVTTLLSRLPSAVQGRCQPLPPVPEVSALAAPLERDIPFASAQAHVLIGQPGYKRSDPDYFPMLVGNYTLGAGGFVSRLSQEVREKRGLSYSIASHFAPGLHAGAFTISLQTRPDQAGQAVRVSREVLARFVAEGPTEAELKAAKDNLIGGFPLFIDTNRKLLDNISNIAWNDLPLDYLDTWIAQVQRVTAGEVKAAFARKLQPQRMVTVIVGGAKAP